MSNLTAQMADLSSAVERSHLTAQMADLSSAVERSHHTPHTEHLTNASADSAFPCMPTGASRLMTANSTVDASMHFGPPPLTRQKGFDWSLTTRE